jgi:hypothetical protein
LIADQILEMRPQTNNLQLQVPLKGVLPTLFKHLRTADATTANQYLFKAIPTV